MNRSSRLGTLLRPAAEISMELCFVRAKRFKIPESLRQLWIVNFLPFPKWELFPINKYRYFPILRRAPFLTMLSTRGCPYGCIYCPYTSNQGLKYRYRSARNVVDELVDLKNRYDVRAVQFRDPTFTIRKDRTLEICDGILKNDIDIEWGCETRVDRLNEELIDSMFEAELGASTLASYRTAPEVISNVHRGWIDPKSHTEDGAVYDEQRNQGFGFFCSGATR